MEAGDRSRGQVPVTEGPISKNPKVGSSVGLIKGEVVLGK